MKILKSNKKLIIGFIIGSILTGGLVYAATEASQITYTRGTNIKNVEQALNDLYTKNNLTATQTGTLTKQGESYTFQHDGYILGTISSSSGYNGMLLKNSTTYQGLSSLAFDAHNDKGGPYNVSLYVTAGTTISTRPSYGVYNLTIYEFQ